METRALLSLPFRLYFLEQKVSHNELFFGPIMFFFSFSIQLVNQIWFLTVHDKGTVSQFHTTLFEAT